MLDIVDNNGKFVFDSDEMRRYAEVAGGSLSYGTRNSPKTVGEEENSSVESSVAVLASIVSDSREFNEKESRVIFG